MFSKSRRNSWFDVCVMTTATRFCLRSTQKSVPNAPLQPKLPFRQPRVARHRVVDHADAQAIALAFGTSGQRVGNGDRSHQLDGPRRQQPLAIQLAAVDEHQAELQVVLGRAEQTAAAGEVGAVDEVRLTLHPAQLAVLPRVPRRRARVAGRVEVRVLHPERVEDALLRELIEAHARDDLDDAGEHVEAVLGAVGPARPRLELQHCLAEARNEVGKAFLVLERHRAARVVADRPAAEAGRMGQQIAHGDVPLGRHGVEARRSRRASGLSRRTATPFGGRRLRHRHLHVLELGDPLRRPDRSAGPCLPRSASGSRRRRPAWSST